MALSLYDLEQNYQDITGGTSLDALESAYQKTLPKPGALESFGKGVAAGTLGVAESVGTALQYTGERLLCRRSKYFPNFLVRQSAILFVLNEPKHLQLKHRRGGDISLYAR